MSLFLDDGDVRLYAGDALEQLARMPSESVQCIVTSPPFWGLRDYGTGAWEGGDADCDHAKGAAVSESSTLKGNGHDGGGPQIRERSVPYAITCGKCGATRVDQQIGLEETPDQWCARLVAVMREARRVLRSDGVCFIEVGDSYASAALRGAAPSDTACTPPPDSPDLGCACCGHGDGRAVSPVLHSRRTDQPPAEPLEHLEPTGRGRSRSDSAAVDAAVAPLDARASIAHAGAPAPPRPSSAEAEDSPLQPQTPRAPSELDAPHRAHTGACNCCTAGTSDPSVARTQGTELSRKASHNHTSASLKQKDLVGAPWMLAFALRADGWYLRSDTIWARPNPMPESVTDRPTKSHSYVFLLSKSSRYFWDADAIREQFGEWTNHRFVGLERKKQAMQDASRQDAERFGVGKSGDLGNPSAGRNARSVWTIPTEPTPFAHFATFPQALVERCIKAGSAEGDVILDPFVGSGTTALVARRLGRHAIGIELNAEYLEIAARRLQQLSLLA